MAGSLDNRMLHHARQEWDTDEHEWPGASSRGPGSSASGAHDDRNPELFADIRPRTPRMWRPGRANGFHVRRAAEALPASRTVFEVVSQSSREACLVSSSLPPGPGCLPTDTRGYSFLRLEFRI